MTQPAFTDEELLKSAQFVANFWLLVTMAYLKRCEQSIADWVRFGGTHVARGFKTREHVSPLEFARTVALRLVSLGGNLERLEGDEKYALATVKFPAQEMVTAFGLSLDELDWFLSGVYESVAVSLGLKCISSRTGETWTWEIYAEV
jgi:hypothetical protein